MTRARSIPEVTFRGDHFARGLQRGRMLRDTLDVPDLPALPPDFVAACRDAAFKLHPAVEAEFEGLIEGGDFDRARMEAYYFARLESRLGGCTMFGIEPPRGDGARGPLVGRNYDWALADLRWCRLERCELPGGPRRIGYTHHWAGCPDALNEHGLYVAIASLPAEPVRSAGVQWSILVDALTEGCGTVEDAIAVCARARHLRPMSYMLADAGGAVAIVEATPAMVFVRRPERGVVLAANAPLGGERVAEHTAADYDLPLGPPEDAPAMERRQRTLERSARRIARAAEMLQGAGRAVTREAIRAVLSDHEAPICTGDHVAPGGGRWGTIWSGICEPAEGEFLIAPGQPCRFDYQSFRLADR
jgi:hypothetical protein